MIDQEQTLLADEEARRLIREATDKTLFVDAGAGSGKTHALVERVRTLVLRDGVPIEQIAAVTFTEKAAAELTDRLRETFETAVKAPGASDQDRQRAERALDELDLAAIGTLHAFAQRILTLHPIEAGIPPALQVLDEVGSTAASEQRWAVIQRRLLDDDEIGDLLVPALAMGVTPRDLHSLARAFNDDWDLAEDRLSADLPAPVVPDATVFFARVADVTARRYHCTKSERNKLYAHLQKMADIADEFRPRLTVDEQHEILVRLAQIKPSNAGNKNHWPAGYALDDLKAEVRETLAEATGVANSLVDAMLRPLAHWIGRQIVEAAQERAATGDLEFHDLLVIARRMLRKDAGVCRSLRAQFSHLLLDEFQDTDPIQIELALRIAGGDARALGVDASYDVPDGSLFVVGDPKQSIYRFRRADITGYLQTKHRLGETLTLSTNFRSAEGVINWVNRVFGSLIQEIPDRQPAYERLTPHLPDPDWGPPVSVIGRDAHPKDHNAGRIRGLEAGDVAYAIRTAVEGAWSVRDTSTPDGHRPIQYGDIAVLLPSRTSLEALQSALEESGIPYRTESSSLVYQSSEIRDLLITARALADQTDELSLVAALRSPLFGVGDDDLWTWRRDGGRFRLYQRELPEALSGHPVEEALAYLRTLHHGLRAMTPAEVLSRLIADRRMMEVAAGQHRTRDSWRRLRFVVDQARAWSEAQHGGLRAYLAWAARQAEDGARVAEAVLPETDVDAVRVMTIHAAKGLEFPMVVLSGMSAQARRRTGVKLVWPPLGGLEVQLRKDIQTNDFDSAIELEEQMDAEEKKRLLYVACTRAKDHLVVSLHRREGLDSLAAQLAANGAAHDVEEIWREWPWANVDDRTRRGVAPPPDWHAWLGQVTAAQRSADHNPAKNASGLEGTDPAIVLSDVSTEQAGLAKAARDIELPPWSKGRYGSAIGSAVHAALQSVDLQTGAGLEGAVQAACLAEGVPHGNELVTSLVRSALDSDLVKRAAVRPHWRESWLATVRHDGTVLEGIADLIYREDDGTLVIIDYKTDAVPGPALERRVAVYRPQVRAYLEMVRAAAGTEPLGRLLFLHPEGTVDIRI